MTYFTRTDVNYNMPAPSGFVASTVRTAPSSEDRISQLATPRLAQLQQAFTDTQTKTPAESDVKSADEKIVEKWKEFDLPPSVLEDHADCARFLFDSGLVYSIVGYRESTLSRNDAEIKLDDDGHPMVQIEGRFVRWETVGDLEIDYLKLDDDGHPMIKMQGRFVRWETLSSELHYDVKSGQIQSKDPAQVWNYYYPLGLVPIDKFNYEQVFPVYELTQEQYDCTMQMALKFYETNPELDQDIPKDSIVQFVTSPRQQLPSNPLLKNANDQYPLHIGMRLITPDCKVYSFGLSMLPEDAAFILSDLASNFMATANAKVTMLDYDEFRPHEGKVVTSIPLTSQRSENILDFLNEINSTQLRFQYAHQNCSISMLEVLKRAGYELDIRTTVLNYLYEALPPLNQIPKIGPLVAKVEPYAKWILKFLPQDNSGSLGEIKNVALFMPRKLLTVLANLAVRKLGGTKMTTPLQDGVEEEELYDKKGFQNFSSVIRSWTDIFKDETSAIYHARYFLDWQREQKSTFFDPYQGRPKLSIVPPGI